MTEKKSILCEDTRKRVNRGLNAYKNNPQRRNFAFILALKGLSKIDDKARIVYIRHSLSDAIRASKSKSRTKANKPPANKTSGNGKKSKSTFGRRSYQDAAAHDLYHKVRLQSPNDQ